MASPARHHHDPQSPPRAAAASPRSGASEASHQRPTLASSVRSVATAASASGPLSPLSASCGSRRTDVGRQSPRRPRLRVGLEPRSVPRSEFMCGACERRARPTPRRDPPLGARPRRPAPAEPASPERFVGDPIGELSERQTKAVAGALRATTTVCKEKARQQAAEPVSAEALQATAERLAKEWQSKAGDLLDELAQNLRAPAEVEAAHGQALVLAAAAQHLHRTVGASYPGCNAAELLVMSLYTMAGPDIDALMTFNDVPNCEDTAAWAAYGEQQSPQRNKAIFGELNWALRTLADKPADRAAGKAVRKWAKFAALLAAVAARGDGHPVLFRGLAGLPAPVVEAHAALRPSDTLRWAAPSSTAVDPVVPETYIRGEAVNATKAQVGGSVLFTLRGATVGVHLRAISKYPKEAEVLLPPFVSFRVAKSALCLRPQLRGTIAMDLTDPQLLMPARELLAAAEEAEGAARLAAMAEDDAGAATLRLERLARRVWQPPAPPEEPSHRRHTGLSARRRRQVTGKEPESVHPRACVCCGQGLDRLGACTAPAAVEAEREETERARAREEVRGRMLAPDAACSPHRRRRAGERSLAALLAGLARPAAEEAADSLLSDTPAAADRPRTLRWRSGRVEERHGDGAVRVALPSAAVVVRFGNGDTQREYSCGKLAYHHADTNVLHTTHTDGSSVVEFLETGQLERHHADGSKDIVFPDGTHAHVQRGA